MCGIICLSKKFNHKLNQTFNLLKHRGPDLENFITLDDLSIGHNLLQIRGELNLSKQPKFAKNRKYILAFNGQIYNTEELKKKFSIDSATDLDTEIIVKLIDQVGLQFIKYIKGMFAILIYDTHEKKIHLFRDPSGQKHLYYYINNEDVIICSEINPFNSILENSDFDNKSLVSNLILGYPLNESTLFKNINRVLPGEQIVIDHNKKISKKLFKQFQNDYHTSDPQRVIQKTIENHLLTKKKIALNLSGGLDSNIILYEALNFKSDISVFSTRFESKDEIYNHDYNLAKKISNYYGVKLYTTNINFNDYLDNFEKSFSYIEEVNRNINNPVYYLNYINQKNNDYRSILSGDGGDEVFIGYDYYRRIGLKRKILDYFKISKILSTFLWFKEYIRYETPNLFIKNNHFNLITKKFLTLQNSLLSKKFYKNFYNSNIDHTSKYFCFLDQFNWLPNETFLRADKLGMRNNLEVRSPFSDLDLRRYFYQRMQKKKFLKKNNKPEIRNIYQDKLQPIITNNFLKTGWTTPKDWLIRNEFVEKVISLVPDQDCDTFRWSILKNNIKKNKFTLLNKNIYSLISLSIIKKSLNEKKNY
tara:strand:- start:2804 stop:4570 length:1767 start_codon:yes stop_codon:yes gene_type:complete